MKLFVDDIRNAPTTHWTVARTIESAIRCIAFFGDDIDEISLDHDISHQIVMGELSRPFPCPETFQPVAYFIAAYYRGKDKCPDIIMHTSNPLGAEAMMVALEKFGEYKGKVSVKFSPAANRLEMEVK